MGQYLVVGIVTRIIADAGRQKFRASVEDLRQSMERKFNQKDIYDVEVEDDRVVMDLKPEIAEPDWEMMIKDFYEMRYQGEKRYCLNFDKVRGLSSLEEWLELADEKPDQGYQTVDQYYFGYPDEIGGWHQYIDTRQKLVALSIDGKIMMECYDGVLDFFTRLIRERLGKYRLAEALSVQICG